jgi:hypothetical protein
VAKDPQTPTGASSAHDSTTGSDAVSKPATNTRSTTQPFGSMAGGSSPNASPSSPAAAGSSQKASPSSPSATGSSPSAAPSAPVVAVGESANAATTAGSATESAANKQFDPWHFGAIPIPTELIQEYDEAMQRFEAGDTPDAAAERALEAGSKVQAYKEGWGKPLSRQFSEDAARSATTQASLVRVRQARTRRLALAAVALLSMAAFAMIWWGLGKSEVSKPEPTPSELASPSEPPARELGTPPPPPPELPLPSEREDPTAAATVIATGTEQAPTPSAASNPESPIVPPVASEPQRTKPKAASEPGSRPSAGEARGPGNSGSVTPAQPTAAAPAPPADDILGGPMTRRPKPKKNSP